MKLEYKGKKWDKEVANFQKMIEVTKGAFNKNEIFTIEKFLNSRSRDYLRLYSRLSGNYREMAVYYYLNDINSQEVKKYTYLSGYALLITKYLYEEGMRTEYNRIVEDIIEGDTDYALYQLIAVGEVDNPYIEMEVNNLIMLIYQQKYEQAELIVKQLPDNPDDSKEIYYIRPEYLKKIYSAIINQDEKAFNEEIIKRIKKYRKNMVGYSTIIDIVSVALIKMAEQRGLCCTVDAIEIPKQFFDETYEINKNEIKLPFYVDILNSKKA